MNRKIFSLSCLFIVIFLPLSLADYLIVSRSATIKDIPHRDATIIDRVGDEDHLALLQDNQENGYYFVQNPETGIEGWIYRTLVRRYPGNIPAPVDTETPTTTIPDEPGIIDVMWWNIRDFSNSSRDADEIAQIANVIRGMEVVAIGELNEPTVLESLTNELGPTWTHAASPKIGHSSYTAEHYGFIWDTSDVSMVGNVQVDPDPGNLIDREPAYATFRSADGNLDFSVIAVHITWGSQGVTPRKAEVMLMDDVWLRTQATTPDDDDLILVGDFNRNVSCASFDELLTISGMIRANEDTGPTKIKSSSTYDQIFLSTDFTGEWTGDWNTINFDELYFGNDDDAANLACSDHRPVTIRLVVPGADDD